MLAEDPETGDELWWYGEAVRDAEGEPVDPTANPDRWAVFADQREAWIDTATGDEVSPDELDADTEGDDDAAPAAGLRHMNTVTEGVVWEQSYWIVPATAEEQGWTLREPTRFHAVIRVGGTGSTGSESGQDTAGAAHAAKEEKERAERRRTVKLNAAGAAETSLRREFLRTVVSKKTPPKGASVWVAATLARDPALLGEFTAAEVTKEVIPACEATGRVTALAEAEGMSDKRGEVLVLAQVLCAYEARMTGSTKSWWRTVPQGVARYLEFLTATGYTTGPVENVVTGEHTAEQAYEDVVGTA